MWDYSRVGSSPTVRTIKHNFSKTGPFEKGPILLWYPISADRENFIYPHFFVEYDTSLRNLAAEQGEVFKKACFSVGMYSCFVKA